MSDRGPHKIIRVLVVEDSQTVAEWLTHALTLDGGISVVGVARDGEEALEAAYRLRPDVITMDILMPKLDGIEATRRIMAQAPCAILVVTSSVGANAWRVYEAMGAGALDAVDTPTLADNRLAGASQPLLAKIDQIGRLLEKPVAPPTPRPAAAVSRGAAPLIAIGASAGGPGALAAVLGKLPADFGGSIVIVQHVDKAFAEGMAQWLDSQTELTVRVAESGDRPRPGEVLLAATNDHLHIARTGSLDYTSEPAATPYRPSVDVFFHSVVEHWYGNAVGVLLSGMGRDGAIGLKAMRAKGYLTIAQDEATSAVYGMPKAAAALDAARRILPLDSIAGELMASVKR